VAGCCEHGDEPFGFIKIRGISWLAERTLIPDPCSLFVG
jgi:hypothetical protein